MALPGDVAVDRPLKLGSTFLGSGGDEGFYTLKLDFQPESLQQANQADLLLLSADQLKLIPLLQEGDVPFHFEGSLEQLQQRSGGDLECVAYFDGNEWTLQLVQAHLRAKHRPGVPLVPGYNVPDEDEAATAAQAVQVAAVQQQLQASDLQSHGHHAAEHEIDPDLDDALEEALFATDKSSSQAQHSGPDQPTHSAPAVTQPLAGAEAHSQPRRPAQQAPGQQLPAQPQPPRPQQQQQSSQQRPQQVQVQVQQQQQTGQPQPQQQPRQQQEQQHQQRQQQQQQQQQPPMQAVQLPPAQPQQRPAALEADEEDDSADDDSDDPWNTFDAAAAPAPAPAASKPAVPPVALQQHRHMSAVSGGPGALVQRSTTPQPMASTAAGTAAPAQAAPTPVQPAPAAAGAVSVGGVSRGTVSVLGADDEEEYDAGHDGHECSEDESDGVGVEYF